MVASVGVYAGLLPLLPAAGSRPAPRPSVVWGLLGTGGAEYLLATLVGRRILSSRLGSALERVRSSFLIRFAAAGAIAVFGLAIHFFGAPAADSHIFFLVSVAAFLLAYPGRSRFDESLRRAGGSQD